VKNAGVSGIRATGAMPSTKITATRVEGGGKTAFGAALSDATGLSFGTATSGNTITGVSSGIIAKGDMSGSTIRSNNVTLNSGGINLLAARGLRVMGNNVSGNSLYGVRAEGNSAGTAVTGNVITGSTFGVFLDRAKSLQLGAPGSGNVVQAGINPTTGSYDPTRTSYGLHATGDLTGTAVVANSIIDNTIGVRLTDARGLSVKDGNLLFRNRFQAIAASGTSTSTIIARNTIEGSLPDATRAPFGIVLDSATGLTVGGEAATDANGIFSTSTALLARGDLTGSAIKRSIIRTMNNGIVLAAARGLWVQSNDVNGAVQQGLNASGDCTGTTVLFNRILGGASGVVIDAAKSLQVTNNVIDANRVGVFATGNCPGTKVADNAVVSNGTNLSTSTATGGWFQPS
jgi:nitrous oxidase accessory protein NosD